jgi:hypothetical protein
MTFFKNGKLESAYSLDEGHKEGDFVTYFKNGNLEAEGIYQNDSLDGEVKFYKPHGELERRAFYENGSVFGVIKYGKEKIEVINIKGGFKLELPKEFKLNSFRENSLAVFKDQEDSVSLLMGANESTMPLEIEVENQITQAKKENNLRLVSSNEISLNGYKGIVKELINKDSDEFMKLYFLKKNKSLINIYFFFPEPDKNNNTNKTKKIIESFAFLQEE